MLWKDSRDDVCSSGDNFFMSVTRRRPLTTFSSSKYGLYPRKEYWAYNTRCIMCVESTMLFVQMSNLVPFHSAQVRDLYLLILGQALKP